MAISLDTTPSTVSNESSWIVTSDKDDATAKSITVFADYSGTVAGTVKVTTSVAHTFLTNDVVTISGTTNYNDTYDITKIDATNFYITHSWDGDDATGTATLDNPNFRIKAELIISAVTVAIKWQPKGSLAFNFKNILWSLITYNTIDFGSVNIQTPNSNSSKAYTVKFTEYWESTANALIEGANNTSSTCYIFKVDVPVADFPDYNLSADDELFLTERPTTNKIRIKDNIITDWTNRSAPNDFDTFTSYDRHITSAIDSSAVNASYCYSNNLGAVSKDGIIIFYGDFTKNSGTFPTIFLIDGTSVFTAKSNQETFAEGWNYIELIATDDISECRICIYSIAANQVNFNLLFVYTTNGYNELDYLAFITEEANMDIFYKMYDIDGTYLGGNYCDITAITGYRGIIPVSAILFAVYNTQVESIIITARETAGYTDRSIDVTFERDSKCYPYPVRIEWLNKFGAFDAYTFTADYNENRKTEREYYKDTSDTEQILDIESYQEIEVFTNFKYKTDLDWLKTIQDSKKVYWIVDNERIEVTVISTDQLIKQSQSKRNRISLKFRRII